MDKLPNCMYDYRYEAPKAKVINTCTRCGGDICEGDEYYQFGTDVICEKCVNDYIREFKRE